MGARRKKSWKSGWNHRALICILCTSTQGLVVARFSESPSCKVVELYNYFYSDKRLRQPETLRPRIPGPIKVAPVVAGLPCWLAWLEPRTFNANYPLVSWELRTFNANYRVKSCELLFLHRKKGYGTKTWRALWIRWRDNGALTVSIFAFGEVTIHIYKAYI